MDKYRQVAFIAAFVVAILIMMLGKACTDSLVNQPVRTAQTATQLTTAAHYNNGYTPVQTTTTTTTAPAQTAPPVNYVTNMFGEIVGTEPAEDVPEIQTTTEELSILEQYNAGKQQNNTPAANNSYETPSEIHITIK